MRRAQVAVTIAVVLAWGLFMPLAMAVGLCATMGAPCEGPCGTSLTAPAPTTPGVTDLISRAFVALAPVAPDIEHAVPDPPPRSLLLSV